jgi:hypothetical protein
MEPAVPAGGARIPAETAGPREDMEPAVPGR